MTWHFAWFSHIEQEHKLPAVNMCCNILSAQTLRMKCQAWYFQNKNNNNNNNNNKKKKKKNKKKKKKTNNKQQR